MVILKGLGESDFMLNHSPTQGEIAEWKRVFEQYKDRFKPNRISGAMLYAYLESRYPLMSMEDEGGEQVVISNILNNECFACELPEGVSPDAVCCIIEPVGAGTALYAAQEKFYSNCDIFVGIDLVTGYFCVEGSSLLWDELFARRGLNENDLKNYYVVAEYVACLERFGLLEQTLNN